MLTLQDCIDLCDLKKEEIEAIAEHEHVPDIIAAEMAQYLIHEPGGVPKLKQMIVEDIERAQAHGRVRHVRQLLLVLRLFVDTYGNRSYVD